MTVAEEARHLTDAEALACSRQLEVLVVSAERESRGWLRDQLRRMSQVQVKLALRVAEKGLSGQGQSD